MVDDFDPGAGSTDIDFDELINGNIHTQDDLEAGALWPRWPLFSMADAYEERPPRTYLVDGLLPCPSLSIVYGGPGSLKSMLLADMALCIATGQQWLQAPQGRRNQHGAVTFNTTQAGVFWIDFDNGIMRTHERFDAFGKALNVPGTQDNLHYTSMPNPWLDASNRAIVDELVKLTRRLNPKLVVIDNLGLITGDTEENSGDMANVMGNLRWYAEETECAVIVVHHQRKSGATTNGVRKGESLRGHSSIEAALDLALLVERAEGSDKVTVIPTKVRGYKRYDQFGALFTYEHKPNTDELASARFFAEEAMSAEEAEHKKIEYAVLDAVSNGGVLNQKQLIDTVGDDLASRIGGKAPSIRKIRGIIKGLVDDGKLAEDGNGKERKYAKL